MAGRAIGLWSDQDLRSMNTAQVEFSPQMTSEVRARLYHGWKRAVERSMGWVEN
jgi:glycerol kinase